MANRRRLKKSINLICGELFADCVALSLCGHDEEEKLKNLMAEVLALHGEYISRISHTEKGQERLFYKKLREEFTEKANALGDAIIKV